MARQRPKQLEPNRIGSSKMGFDGEEDGWVFVKKQRVIIVLPSLPVTEPFTVDKPPATSHSQQAAHVVVVPSLPLPEQFVLQKPETCQSLVELRDVIAKDIHGSTSAQSQAEISDVVGDKHETTPLHHTVVPSLSLPEHFVLQKPVTSKLQAALRDGVADTLKTTRVHTVVPSLPVTEHITLQKPATLRSQTELRAEEMRKAAPVHTMVPSLPVTEHITLQKPATLKPQAELKAKETRKATLAHTVVPSRSLTEHITLQRPAASLSQAEIRAEETRKASLAYTGVSYLPVTEPITLQNPATSQSQAASTVGSFLSVTEYRTLQKPVTSQSQAALRAETLKATRVQAVVPSSHVFDYCTLQKPATSQSQAELRAKTRKATLAQAVVPPLPVLDHYNLQKPATSQSQAELRAKETRKATMVQAVVPSLPVLDYCTLKNPATPQLQAEPRDFVSDAQETADFQAVDKPERVMDRRKAPGPRRSLQDRTMDPNKRFAVHRTRGASHKPLRFPRVMCSSVVMDNEKLRVVNLEKKVEKAGGLNEWVGSIGLGREFERMLRGQRMSKFQMANLTMEKLKQMGALAVGPRRKLIHAIRCVYHPHCLRASFN